MIHTAEHRELIEPLLLKQGLDPLILEVVDDVADRSTQLGYPDANPFRLARSIRRPAGESFILISSQITDDMVESAKSAMTLRGFSDEVQRLSTNEAFLTHLVLHEVAAFVLRTAEQEPRDRWAFQQMDCSR